MFFHRSSVSAALLLAGAGLLTACAGVSGVTGGPRTLPGGGADATGLTGTWRGGFHCAEGYGDARLTLELTGNRRGRLEGELGFEVIDPEAPLPPGRLRVAGAYGAEGDLRLGGTEWISRPGGLAMPGLEGRVGADGDHLSGQVPACGPGSAFYLERLAPE
jgi:hypothetical protein